MLKIRVIRVIRGQKNIRARQNLIRKSAGKTAKYSVFEKYFYKIRKKVVVAAQKVTVKRCYCHACNKLNQSELR